MLPNDVSNLLRRTKGFPPNLALMPHWHLPRHSPALGLCPTPRPPGSPPPSSRPPASLTSPSSFSNASHTPHPIRRQAPLLHPPVAGASGAGEPRIEERLGGRRAHLHRVAEPLAHSVVERLDMRPRQLLQRWLLLLPRDPVRGVGQVL